MSFGITGTALQWLRSYLYGRSRHVIVNGEKPESLNLPFGVPQGSCLGPLLFTLYSTTLFEEIKPHLPEANAYADYSQLYLSFKPNNEVNESESIKSMELCIRAIRTWMKMDKLKLNDDKTEFMITGNRQQLEKISVAELSVGDISVAAASTARNLGVLLDRNLKFDAQITKTCCTGYCYLHNIRKIRKYLITHEGPVCNARFHFCFDEFENDGLTIEIANSNCSLSSSSFRLAEKVLNGIEYPVT